MKIGYSFCGSYCTHQKSIEALQELTSPSVQIIPILSYNVSTTDTRFGSAEELKTTLFTLTGNKPIVTVCEAEPLGPSHPLDALIISPCTGNTLAKLANGITDTPVCMAAKAHLRADRPLLIALASNDALSVNLENIGRLLVRKNVYFVPMFQDDPLGKPHSLVADFKQLSSSFELMMKSKQKRPLFISR